MHKNAHNKLTPFFFNILQTNVAKIYEEIQKIYESLPLNTAVVCNFTGRVSKKLNKIFDGAVYCRMHSNKSLWEDHKFKKS